MPHSGGSCWPIPRRHIGAQGWVTCTLHLQGCPSHAAHLQVRAATRWRVGHAAPQGTVLRRGGDSTGMRVSSWKSSGTRVGGFPFTSCPLVYCRVACRDSQLSQSGWDSLTWQWGCGLEHPIIAPLFSKICGGRGAASRSQPQGPWCPGTPGEHPKGEQSFTPIRKGPKGHKGHRDGPNLKCCQSTQCWPPASTQASQGRE